MKIKRNLGPNFISLTRQNWGRQKTGIWKKYE